MGIPLGRLADRVSRKYLIIVGLAIWSIATMGCGFAISFGQLFLLRMSVGVGEAVLNPSSYSIISDTFPKEKLGKAISVYASGINLGIGVAFILLLPVTLLYSCPYGVLPAAIQVISPNQLRGQISAVYILCNNIIGLGLGPTIVALITDQVYQDDQALRYSLAIVLGVTAPLSALCFYLCMKPFRHSVERARQWAR